MPSPFVPRSLVVMVAACSTPGAPAEPPVRAAAVASAPLPRIVAHRGASFDAPENTMAAFRRAWAVGAEGVELDVRLSKDGQVVVVHDPTTKRTTGVDLPIADQTLAQLRALDAGGWKSAAFAGERIPTIGEVLGSIPPGRMLFIEMKSGRETAPAIARAILAADPRPRGARIALLCFDPDGLSELSAALPGVAAFWLVGTPRDRDRHPQPYSPAIVTEARRRGFAGLAFEAEGLDDAYLAAVRDAGLAAVVWVVDTPQTLQAWQGRDVRWIETNRPELGLRR